MRVSTLLLGVQLDDEVFLNGHINVLAGGHLGDGALQGILVTLQPLGDGDQRGILAGQALEGHIVPEGRRVFPNLTVLENLQIGAYMRNDKEEIAKDIKWVYELFPRLEERSWQMAGTLSGGEQQMLAVGRALLSRPQLMMMDEPSLGLAPLIIKDIFNIIQEINSRGMTILLIEQNANMALKVAHQAYVLETGKITMSGTGQELLENPDIKAAYLGKKRNQK